MSTEKVMQNYMDKITREENIDNLKNIIKEMFKDTKLNDIDLEWIFNHCLILRLKEYFNIDIVYLAEKNNIGTYEYIIRKFLDNENI